MHIDADCGWLWRCAGDEESEDEMEVETMLGAVLAIHHPCARPQPQPQEPCLTAVIPVAPETC
mgnify:CR=1 FL=1